MRKLLVLARLTAVLAANPVLAEGVIPRPESCVRIATAQFDNCSVTNVFRCTDDQAAFWIETLDADTVMTVETRNADHGSQTLDFVGQGASIVMTQSKAHPRDTVANGTAEDSITGKFMMFGMSSPIVGQTTYGYAGEMIALAGTNFARIAFNGRITLPPPMPEMAGGGTYLYSEELDLLIEESVSFDADMAKESYRLAKLSLSGQDGFGDETPGFGCGQLSQMATPAPKVPA